MTRPAFLGAITFKRFWLSSRLSIPTVTQFCDEGRARMQPLVFVKSSTAIEKPMFTPANSDLIVGTGVSLVLCGALLGSSLFRDFALVAALWVGIVYLRSGDSELEIALLSARIDLIARPAFAQGLAAGTSAALALFFILRRRTPG